MRSITNITKTSALLFILTILAPPSVLAVPMLYTFSGTVNWGPVDGLGMIPGGSNPFGYGDSVSMVWEVDLAGPATVTDLTTSIVTSLPAFGYARLVSGGMLNPADVGITTFDGIATNAFYNNGSSLNNAHLQDVKTTLDGNSYFLEIRKDGGAVTADYYAGATGFSVYERVIKDGLATRYQVLNALTLTSITAVPVPAPSVVGFLLVGLIALFGWGWVTRVRY